uniref:Uncharacterized protein n=1 Tax=Anguilla anguilla TaxID=7936 RepID=A0A0E9U771_ANGAN
MIIFLVCAGHVENTGRAKYSNNLPSETVR